MKNTSFLLNMTIASYLAENPDSQVAKMAKAYKKRLTHKDNAFKALLKAIYKSKKPARMVRVCWEQFSTIQGLTVPRG